MNTQASIIFLQQCTTWLEKIATAKQKELYCSLEKQANRAAKKAVQKGVQAITGATSGAKQVASKTTRVQAAGARQGNPRNAKVKQGKPAAGTNPGWFSRHPVLTATLGAAGGGALTYAMTPSRYSGLANAYANAYNTNPTAADLTSYYGVPNDNSAAAAFVNSYYGAPGR